MTRYALVVENEPHELTPGVPFEAGGIQYPGNLLSLWDPAEMTHIGVLPIQEAPPVPDGYFLVSKRLEMQSGAVVEVNVTQVIPLSKLRERKLQALAAKYAAIIAPGVPVVFDGVPETLQVRHVGDLVNWLVFRETCKDEVAAGNGAELAVLPIRATSNTMYQVTNTRGVEITSEVRSWFFIRMAVEWLFKDQIEHASTKAALDAINLEVGWPQ